MKTTYDLFAESNPAFLAFLIYRFTKEFSKKSSEGPNLALVYVAVPLSLSDSISGSFTSTNAATGFLGWINRFPEIRVGLSQNLEASKTLTTEGLRVGLHSRLLRLSDTNLIEIGNVKLPPENVKDKLPEGPKRAIRRAERLGNWMSNAGEPAMIFSTLEVRI